MDGWHFAVWGAVCAFGALLFLAIIARAVQAAQRRLENMAEREQRAYAKLCEAKALSEEES